MSSDTSNNSTASHSSCTSCASDTSALEYDHESYKEFAPRIHQLCRQLWPSASEDEEFEVERLKGGSYNRVFGIKTPPSTGEAEGRYILRIPRFQIAQQRREIAILRYVQKHTSIPVADVIFSDSTTQNPLNEPYVVQTRIAGQDLEQAYQTLDHEQKRAIAKQWGQILLEQRTVKTEFSGVVDASTNEGGTQSYTVHAYDVFSDPEADPVEIDLVPKQSILDMFVTQCARWDAAEIRTCMDYDPNFRLDHWDRLATIAKVMDAAGLFKDSYFTLCHFDLHPRNVMVDIQADGAAVISGVLDWDSAVFAPDFAVCIPPSWIWAWRDDEDERTDESDDTPADPKDQVLKQDFEEAVGSELRELFYAPQYRMARKLFNFALEGLRNSKAWKDAYDLIGDWAAFQSESERTDAFTSVEESVEESEEDSEEESDEESEEESVEEVPHYESPMMPNPIEV
ncbi:MAG: hypothetical protein Q9182_004543 [Xanthomendoza sp. 2 TL-2023]